MELDFSKIDFAAAVAGEEEDELEYEPEWDDETIRRATHHTSEPSIYTPNELLPPELDGMDLSAYDIIEVEVRGGAEKFLGLYLQNTKATYATTGVGVYECVLRFAFRRAVNDEDVIQYFARCRAMLSRLRKENPKAEFFYLALMQYEILPDRKHVAVSTGRMAPANYGVWISEKRRASNFRRSGLNHLKDML